MNSMTTVEAQDRFADVVRRAAVDKERLVVTDEGRALAAIVPIEDMELLEELEDRLDVEEAMVAIAEAEALGTIPLAEVEANLDRHRHRG